MELDGSSSIPRSCLPTPLGSILTFGGGGGGGGRITADAEGPGGEDVEDVTMDADGIRNSFTEDGSSVLKIIVVCILTATLTTTTVCLITTHSSTNTYSRYFKAMESLSESRWSTSSDQGEA